ncbi:RNA polymerase-binding protein DksA [Pelagibacterales bacterium]|jgi:DnaK suppressor protein|nr:RNA polymerase-binding protein DksA [Pelagibacterales bacterium]MDA7763935.1 RNA polymerase-binding protein DksA [Pelagibacterales bacterium]MDA9137169.1 RNA polymerase-binding protein DksA [Pelagibacterales bacterium]MDA9980583.1 RNA polymerase-binding protein DksA [Pelagibacterales bacterium]MDB9986182.1 RNA polymerase-binding protein DksA [Pelagibacterales bacterium]|tara:strand:- start:116 stop:529 length:414 start_codon:yes stop_codon:yes gene_type:complete
MATKLPKNYSPSTDEKFMNAKQKEFFRVKLNDWKAEIHKESRETVENLQDSNSPADISDRATQESEKALELRTRDRQRKLIGKIDEAISRIDNGTYGYCEVTGEPIGLARLEARPVTTLSIEAQELHERSEKLHSND